MNLLDVRPGEDCIIENIDSEDEELKSFLFSLGCYSGETVTLISKKRGGYVLSIKDGRYSIDEDLAKVIEVNEGRM